MNYFATASLYNSPVNQERAERSVEWSQLGHWPLGSVSSPIWASVAMPGSGLCIWGVFYAHLISLLR